MVVTQKLNRKVRVCLNPKHLNQAWKRRHYPLTVAKDILPELSKVRVLTKADLKDGFLQIQLDEESSIRSRHFVPLGKGSGGSACHIVSQHQNVSNNSSNNVLRD